MKLFLSLAKSSLLILLLCCCNNTLFAQTPIAYYPFTGNANDAIGTNHGTVNGATLTTDRFGNANSAYQFDGVNDIINFANLATTQVDNFTVSAWVNSANLNQWGFIVANCYDDGSSANGWTLLQRSTAQVGGATGAYVSGHYSAASWLDIGQSMNSTNTWYHLTLVRDNGVTKFYLNGTSNGQTNNATPNTPTGSLAIGGSYPSANFFNGAIDEVKIYNTALTPTQVQQEYTSSAPTLIAHYPFTGNANDAIGTNHGTVNGATLTTDRFGNANSAYQFDGVNDIINFANLATTQVDNFTMTAWVKTASLNQYAQIAINGTDQPGVTADGWGIRQRNISYSAGSPGSYITADYPNVAVLNIGQTISTANQWIQVALVRNNGVSSFYINGVS
ncbi:MAG TPA: LamG domain-containing protein, partial [Chitinophagaceae bacterium]|nr:LamG domain-containing protein [Chitinophagaceae bacterium]